MSSSSFSASEPGAPSDFEMEMPPEDSNPIWCRHPARREYEAGYTLFRRVVRCRKPTPFRLAVTADHRFNCYLDGELLGRGPVRSDLEHYCYDVYAGTLAPGEHIFAAEVLVWRGGWRRSAMPWSEMHSCGGFLAFGRAGEETLDTPTGWLCAIDEGRRPRDWDEAWEYPAPVPAPPLDEVDLSRTPSGWTTAAVPDGEWVPAFPMEPARFRARRQNDPASPWNLIPRPIRQMEERFTPIARILRQDCRCRLEDGLLRGSCPAGTHRILLDLGRNQTSIIRLAGRGGRGSCRIACGESLYGPDKQRRFELPGELGTLGYADLLHLPGGENEWRYESFWYRTGRFIELEFELNEAVSELKLEFTFLTYPFSGKKKFRAPGDPVLERIYEIAVHTLQCCSHEHFEDCPYYEQLQYAGDTRIEALVSYAVTGDDSLGRQALRMFAHSQLSSGLTQSRYPSNVLQIIPGYCLAWALMVHDHYRCFGDAELVRELLPNLEFMLDAFERNRRPDGLIGPMEGWHFTDWAKEWPEGASDRGTDQPETILNLFYAEACRRVAELREALGRNPVPLRERAEQTLAAVVRSCYDAERRRFRDVPGEPWYSVHANALAVLFEAVPEAERAAFLREILADPGLTQPTLYFDFYILAALDRYGTKAELRARLRPWEEMLSLGLTTFPETPSLEARSLCHAWSCAPACFLGRLEAD